MKPNLVPILSLGALLGGGCAHIAASPQTNSFSNAYRAAPQLPPQVRRIAVLPVTAAAADFATEQGRDALEPGIDAELRKQAVADLVVVTRDELWDLTGRREWTVADALPQDFFERLRRATGCDAVVFCDLTYFRAYPPLAVGWRMQLVDVEKRILWAVDELFDAGNPAIAAAARRYGVQCFGTSTDGSDTILFSPRQFGQYAAARALGSLPGR
jgi:hypothetical protein